jgi:hypothetical protein
MSQRAPRGLKAAGARLWREATAEFDYDADHRVILHELCAVVDTMEDLKVIVAAEGLMAESSQGLRTHPAVTELRQQRLLLVRLARQLRLPVEAL